MPKMINLSKGDKNIWEFYPTPWSLLKILVEPVFKDVMKMDRPEFRFGADFGSGSGRWGKMILEHFPQAWIDNYELNPQAGTEYGDVLKLDIVGRYDFVVSNPPFSLSVPFFEKAFEAVRANGFVAMLLRSAFEHTMPRYRTIFREYGTRAKMTKFVIPKRPCFYPKGHPAYDIPGKALNSFNDYAVYVFEKSPYERPESSVVMETRWLDTAVVSDKDYRGVLHDVESFEDLYHLGFYEGEKLEWN